MFPFACLQRLQDVSGPVFVPLVRKLHFPSSSIAHSEHHFRHLPPNSARFTYATEAALFISAQLSSDAVSALRKVRVLIRLWKQPSAQART